MLTLHVTPTGGYRPQTEKTANMRYALALGTVLLGILIGVGLSLATTAVANDGAGAVTTDTPVGLLVGGGASLLGLMGFLVGRIQAAAQNLTSTVEKVIEKGVTITVKLSDDDVERLEEKLEAARCQHPGNGNGPRRG